MEKPEIVRKIIDKRGVYFNIRESRLDYMFHRGNISEHQYVAGSKYRRLCETAQFGGRAASLEPKVDNADTNSFESKLGAIFYLVAISRDLGNFRTNVLKLFCYENYSIKELCKKLNLSNRKTSNSIQDSLTELAIFFGLIKQHNTIKGRGVKKMEIKKILDVDSK
jgi:hypothetical protein